jgi:hypothetical protein
LLARQRGDERGAARLEARARRALHRETPT